MPVRNAGFSLKSITLYSTVWPAWSVVTPNVLCMRFSGKFVQSYTS